MIRGIAYGGSWAGEMLSTSTAVAKMMPRRPKAGDRVKTYRGSDVVEVMQAPERYEVKKVARYDGKGGLEEAYYFWIPGSEVPEPARVFKDARAAGLVTFRSKPMSIAEATHGR